MPAQLDFSPSGEVGLRGVPPERFEDEKFRREPRRAETWLVDQPHCAAPGAEEDAAGASASAIASSASCSARARSERIGTGKITVLFDESGCRMLGADLIRERGLLPGVLPA